MAATASAVGISAAVDNSLKGKVALITGASRGIGKAISLEFARHGATVVGTYNSNAAKAEEVAAEMRAMGGECLMLQGDVAREDEARRLVNAAVDQFKRVDILVNNAGITRDHTLRKMTVEEWEQAISVNLNGTFYCTWTALPFMTEQKFGRIINIASIVGQMGAFGQANYAASKGGIIAFTKCIALEYARDNITANAVAPGYTSTEMVEAMPADVLDKICAKIPLRRLATPLEIAKAVLFLARDADYITGITLSVNGGLLMF